MRVLVVVFFLLLSMNLFAQDIVVPHNLTDFSKSKKLMKKVYKDHQISFYCGCKYDYIDIKGSQKTVVDSVSCGYTPRKDYKRGQFIEWEHVVPAHAFGNSRACWREALCVDKNGKAYKGRKCCNKIDPVFKAMQADLYNLQPAVGELNGDRKNYNFGIIQDEPRQYGSCDFEIEGKIAEPKEDIRGDIARTYFYMEDTYNVRISDKQRKLFEIWDRQDPVDDWERTRAKRIEEIQGNKNKFIN